MPGRTCRGITEVGTWLRALRGLPEWAVYLVGSLPGLWIIALALLGGLGPDPVRDIEQRLGLLGLQFLVAGLCLTPLRWGGVNLIRHRRALGLLAFAYLALHLAVWLMLDMGLRWDRILQDLTRRWYLVIGMAAFVLLIPLALTSNAAAIRRLGPRHWRQLHRLAYIAPLLGAWHFVMVGKVWQAEPLIYLALLAGLVLARVWHGHRRAA